MIKIHNMKKTFLDKTIFNDFNLEVKSGEFIGVYGKSGQGKTTLLNIIGTLEKPDSGEILIMEKSLENKKTKRYLLRDEIGFIFQNYALIDNETVNNNLEIALKHKKMSKPQKRSYVFCIK